MTTKIPSNGLLLGMPSGARPVAVMVVAMALAAALAGGLSALAAQPAQAAFPGENGKIAFSSYLGDGPHEIYVMNPNGSGVTKLTSGDEPAFSSDGTRSRS